jgi:SAM-dependent methyltransferase
MQKKPLAYEAYQDLAFAYADKIDTKPHNAYYDRPAMLSLMPELDGRKVLDAGCGPGAYAEQLVARGAQVLAIDVSERMLELAEKRLQQAIKKGQVELRVADLTQPLKLADEEFDFVNAPLCLDYVEDWQKLFCDFLRILKPGGLFLFSCGHPSFDAEYYETSKYFSVEQVECTWKGFNKHVRMPSYRRSLEEVLMPVIKAGFLLDKVHEPLPTEEFRSTDPIRYRNLTHRPGFLCVRARKPDTSRC